MSFSPPGESAAALLFEKSILAGSIVSAAAYGVHLTIFLLCFRLLWKEPRKTMKTYFLLAYISCAFTLGTLAIASSSVITQYTFIDDRNFPGGPSAFAAQDFSIGVQSMGDFCSVIGNWFTDALLVWRGLTIYRGTRWIWLMAFPGLVFVGAFTMSIRFLVEIMKRDTSLLTGFSVLLPYVALSESLNVMVSILIASRLLIQRKRIINVLGGEHASQYVSVAAMIIESASLSSTFAVTYLILYGLKHPVQNVFLYTLNQVVFIAPLLIIYRVAQGRAWSSQTSSVVSAIHAHSDSQLRVQINKTTKADIGAVPIKHTIADSSRSSASGFDDTTDAEGNVSLTSTMREDINVLHQV